MERRLKNPVRSRGCGVMSVFPSARTRRRTSFWGVSGLTLTHAASRKKSRVARRWAAASAPTKLGIRWCTGRGKRAMSLASMASQTRSRMAHFQAPRASSAAVAASTSPAAIAAAAARSMLAIAAASSARRSASYAASSKDASGDE